MSRARNEILDSLSTEDKERLLEWFLESARDGWRPIMESWTSKVSGRYAPLWLPELLEKGDLLMRELVTWKNERGL